MTQLEQYRNNVLLKCLVGSHCYGLAHEKSDEDFRGIFILPESDYEKQDSRLLIHTPFLNQIQDEKNNEVYYELKRFLELLSQGNPNCVEILFLEKEFYKIKNPILIPLFKDKKLFLNKKFANALLGFIDSQIRKATGANKKSFNPVDKELKTPLDFCFLVSNKNKSITTPLKEFLVKNNIKQQACGISKIPSTRDNYNLFHDKKQQRLFFDVNIFGKVELSIRKKFNLKKGLHYKGIELEDKSSNMLRLSEIPKGEKSIAQFTFNAQSYTDYLNDYHQYWNWVKERNEDRYIQNQLASKGYDTKNMAHCYRLLKMLEYYLDNNNLVVDAQDKETIWKIKEREFVYEDLIKIINEKYQTLKNRIKEADIANDCDINILNNIEIDIRRNYYNKRKKSPYKDNHGQEIYEGDTVSTYCDNKIKTHIVKYSEYDGWRAGGYKLNAIYFVGGGKDFKIVQ
jgi:hypothetical protein